MPITMAMPRPYSLSQGIFFLLLLLHPFIGILKQRELHGFVLLRYLAFRYDFIDSNRDAANQEILIRDPFIQFHDGVSNEMCG